MKCTCLEITEIIHLIGLGWLLSVGCSSLLIAIGNSLNFDLFQQRIRDVLLLREQELLKNKNLSICIDPRIAEIFKSSAMVASKLISKLMLSSK